MNFIASLGHNVLPFFFSFLNFCYLFHFFLLLRPVYQSFVIFIFSLVIKLPYFSYFRFVMFKTRVILCNTLKKDEWTIHHIHVPQQTDCPLEVVPQK